MRVAYLCFILLLEYECVHCKKALHIRYGSLLQSKVPTPTFEPQPDVFFHDTVSVHADPGPSPTPSVLPGWRSRVDVIEGGVSIGTLRPDRHRGRHYYGTAGIVLRRRSSGEHVILTAAHTFDDTTTGLLVGTPIVQPASSHPSEADVIGHVVFVNTTKADCALISLTGRTFKPRAVYFFDELEPPQAAIVSVGLYLWKFGAATGSIPAGRVVSTTKQIATPYGVSHNHILVRGDRGRPFAQAADSGAVVLDGQNAIVGLLRASFGNYSVITPWDLVEKSCDVVFEGAVETEDADNKIFIDVRS